MRSLGRQFLYIRKFINNLQTWLQWVYLIPSLYNVLVYQNLELNVHLWKDMLKIPIFFFFLCVWIYYKYIVGENIWRISDI